MNLTNPTSFKTESRSVEIEDGPIIPGPAYYSKPIQVQVVRATARWEQHRDQIYGWTLELRTKRLKKDGTHYDEGSSHMESRSWELPEVQAVLGPILFALDLTEDQVRYI